MTRPATAHRILPLNYAADIRTLGFLSALTVLFAIEWTHWYRHWFLLPFTYVLAFVATVAKHNHVHSPIFSRSRWNFAMDLWLSILTGQPTSGIITAHNELHHEHSNTNADFVRCSLVNHRRNWINLLAFPFASVWAMYREKPKDLERWRHEYPPLYRRAVCERAVTYPFILCVLLVDWKSSLIYLIAPWLFAQWTLISINLLQHQDCDPESVYNHSRNVTGRFVNWWLLNNGYHTAHHLFPAMHWSLLPQIHRLRIAPRARHDLSERSLFLSVWRRFILGKGWKGNHA